MKKDSGLGSWAANHCVQSTGVTVPGFMATVVWFGPDTRTAPALPPTARRRRVGRLATEVATAVRAPAGNIKSHHPIH
jgi:hypothetical protein